MGFLTIARIDGDPDVLIEGYRGTAALMDGVGHDHGLVLHAAARTPEGLLILNLWPSEEGSLSAAADPRRHSALARHGVSPGSQRREHHVLERYVIAP